MPRGVARCAAEQELHVRALRPGGGAARREPEEEEVGEVLSETAHLVGNLRTSANGSIE